MKTILLFATVFLITCNCEAEDATKPLLYLSGTDSKVSKASYDRITNTDELAKIWAQHLGTSKEDSYRPLMEVDFSRCMVIAICRGKQIQVRQLEIDSIKEWKNDFIVIRFNELGYSIGATGKMPEPEYKYPYAFVVLPKTHKTIILEENDQQNKGGPPEWKEVIRLERDGKRVQVRSGKPRILGRQRAE